MSPNDKKAGTLLNPVQTATCPVRLALRRKIASEWRPIENVKKYYISTVQLDQPDADKVQE